MRDNITDNKSFVLYGYSKLTMQCGMCDLYDGVAQYLLQPTAQKCDEQCVQYDEDRCTIEIYDLYKQKKRFLIKSIKACRTKC